MITVLGPDHEALAIIDRYTNDTIQETINGEYKLAFTALIEDDGKSEYLVEDNLIEVEDQLFNIVHHRRTRANDGSLIVAVDGEQVAYDLLRFEWEDGFVHAGTPADLLAMILEGTGFSIGSVEVSEYISVDLAEENVNARTIMMEIAALSGGELFFDRYTISLLAPRGQLRGVQFLLGKNLKGIIKDVDTRSGEIITAYEVDVQELRELPEFAGWEEFDLGDSVFIVDPELGIDEEQRIISYTYSPRRRINSKVVISNAITGITDAVVSLKKTTIVKDKVYNGTRIGPEVGFEAIRSDKMARAVMNATEGIKLQKGNGSGSSWTDVIYLDTEGNGIFSGRVIAASFEGGTIMIGSGNNAFRASDWGIWLGNAAFADAPFSVNPAGHMKAVDAEFSGKITASDIDGGVITGALIRTGLFGVYPRAEMSDSDKTFSVWASVTNGIQMQSSGYPNSIATLRFTNDNEYANASLPGGEAGFYLHGSGNLTMEFLGDIKLRGYNSTSVLSWANLRSELDGRSLQAELDEIRSAIADKANLSHSHSLTLPNHNHGSATLVPSGGGTYGVS
ncbi:phage tail protein [Paenibacillus sp. RS8]|uniref:phage tail protein n=1 Tax=Paenibacillus sp. RS8 TaxID=3242681 RepID=UPI0035C03A6F